MSDFEKRNADQIPLGMEVIGYDGRPLGYVREAHEHFILVGTGSAHEDLEVPVQSVLGIENGKYACMSPATPPARWTTRNPRIDSTRYRANGRAPEDGPPLSSDEGRIARRSESLLDPAPSHLATLSMCAITCRLPRIVAAPRSKHPSDPGQSIGFRFATISVRRGSRKGGSTTFSPSVAISSSTPKPGPSVAISKSTPFGSRK